MRTPIFFTFVAVAVISCSTRAETVNTFYAQYQYALAYPTEDVHAGEVRTLVWKATQAAWSAQQPPPLRLCFALMGAYANANLQGEGADFLSARLNEFSSRLADPQKR